MTDDPPTLSRRDAIALMAAAAGGIAALNQQTFGATPGPATPYGTDPFLNKSYKPGDFWPLTLTRPQRATVKALSDLILPADGKTPAASEVGVVEFVDEWISAPYEIQRADRQQILDGLNWLEGDSLRRFGKGFPELTREQQSAIADDLAFLEKAKPEFKEPAAFFAKFRNITAGGYYATKQGMKDIGFVGNVPLARWDGPSPSIKARLAV